VSKRCRPEPDWSTVVKSVRLFIRATPPPSPPPATGLPTPTGCTANVAACGRVSWPPGRQRGSPADCARGATFGVRWLDSALFGHGVGCRSWRRYPATVRITRGPTTAQRRHCGVKPPRWKAVSSHRTPRRSAGAGGPPDTQDRYRLMNRWAKGLVFPHNVGPGARWNEKPGFCKKPGFMLVAPAY